MICINIYNFFFKKKSLFKLYIFIYYNIYILNITNTFILIFFIHIYLYI